MIKNAILSAFLISVNCVADGEVREHPLESITYSADKDEEFEQKKYTNPVSVIEVAVPVCENVVHIGDSTSVGLIKLKNKEDRIDYQYKKLGIKKVYFEADGGRSLLEHSHGNENGPMVAKRIKRSGFRGCWVIALGTNDAANIALSPRVSASSRIDRMMSIIDGDPVMWVDLKTIRSKGYYSSSSMKSFNLELEKSLERYANMKIYKWSDDAEDSWFTKDGIHNSIEGKIARSKLIPQALMGNGGVK